MHQRCKISVEKQQKEMGCRRYSTKHKANFHAPAVQNIGRKSNKKKWGAVGTQLTAFGA